MEGVMSGAQPRQWASLADLADLARLMEEHRPRLLAMVRRRLDPRLAVRLDAEAIIAEAFLVAGRRWDAFCRHDGLDVYSWLYGLVRDCLIEAWRKASRDCRDCRRDLPWPEESSVQLVLGCVQSGDGPGTQVAKEELRQRMQQALDLLKEGDREVLWMRHFDQLSYREIGQVFGIQESAATMRYVRALRRLKDLWHKLYPREAEEP
jgi:RNA polymerase sigma-70 factor (ECF subfamily)